MYDTINAPLAQAIAAIVDSAVAIASDGTIVYLNRSLGFSFRPFGVFEYPSPNLPVLDLSEHPEIQAAVDDFAIRV